MYHASNVDLKVGDYLIPNPKRGRLYATKEKYQCLVFGRNSESLRDMTSMINTLQLKNAESGIEYVEHFPGIFEKEFKNKSAYIYEVEDDGFVQGQWTVEYFKTEKAKIIKKYKVKDLCEEILKFQKRGKIKVEYYTETKQHVEKVINHISQMLGYGFPIDEFIKLAKDYGAITVEKYFKGLKRLRNSTLDLLPEKDCK